MGPIYLFNELKKIENNIECNSKYEQYTTDDINLDQKYFALLDEKLNWLSQSNLYKRISDFHGKKHVANVMFYAALLAQLEKIEYKYLDILLDSAMYHDQGRITDEDDLHGPNSARIVEQDLKEKYNIDEIKMIKTAIIFHDDITKGKSLEESENNGFNKIIKEQKLDNRYMKITRQISNILKDADALDRSRFIGTEFVTSPINEKYLRTKSSKKLQKISIQMEMLSRQK